MVSDCIHHRSAGTEFGHASEVTFSEIGIITMMHGHCAQTYLPPLALLHSLEVSRSNLVSLGLCDDQQQDLHYCMSP